MVALTSDGIFHILFGIIFIVLFGCLVILLFVRFVLFCYQKDRIKIELLFILLLFSIYNILPLVLRILSNALYIAPNFHSDISLQIVAILLAIPTRSIITSFSILYSILLCIFAVQFLRMYSVLHYSVWNRFLFVGLIFCTIIYSVVLVSVCIAQGIELTIFVIQHPNQWDTNINNLTLPITSVLLYSCVPLFLFFVLCITISFFGIVVAMYIQLQHCLQDCLKMIVEKEQFIKMELREDNSELVLNQILSTTLNPNFSSTIQIQLYFKILFRTWKKSIIGFSVVLCLVALQIVVYIFVGLGTAFWEEMLKMTHVVSRLFAVAIIVVSIITKDWFSTLYAQIMILQKANNQSVPLIEQIKV